MVSAMADHQERIDASELLAEAGWLRAFSRTLADPESALDLEQEALRIALERPPSKGSGLRPWLRTVVLNLRRRARRDGAARKYYEGQAARPEVDAERETSQRLELQALVVEALAGLEEPLRTAIRLRHLDGLSYAEVAARMGTTEAAARKRVSRGIERLRARLDRDSGRGGRGWDAAVAGASKVALTRPDPLFWGTMMTKGMKLCLAALVALPLAALLWQQIPGLGTHAPKPQQESRVAAPAMPLEESDDESKAINLPHVERSRVALVDEAPASVPSEVPPWGRLELTIVDDATGEPQPALFVDFELYSPGGGASDRSADAEDSLRGWPPESDAKGRISGEIRAGVAFSLNVLHANMKPLEVLPLEAGERREIELRVDAVQLPKFWIRVVRESNGSPVPSAELRGVVAFGEVLDGFGSIDESHWLEHSLIGHADENGYLAIPHGRYPQRRFVATAPGFGRSIFSRVRSAGQRESAHEVALPDLAQLDVEVVDAEQAPVEGFIVRLIFEADESVDRIATGEAFAQHTVTRSSDERGHAHFGRLNANKEIRAELRAPGVDSIWQPVLRSLPALAAGERRTTTMVAHAVTDVRGLALDQYAAPASGITMLLLPDSDEAPRYFGHGWDARAKLQAVTDRDGHFQWGAVPAGRWLVVPRMERRFWPTFTDEGHELSELVAPMPIAFELTGTQPIHDLQATLWRGLYVSGVVLDSEGQPCSDAHVEIKLEGGEFLTLQPAREDGTFTVGPLPDVPLQLSASSYEDESSSQVVEVRAGAEGLSLQLVPYGSLPIRTVKAANGGDCVCKLITAWRTNGAGQVVESKGYGPNATSLDWRGLGTGTWHLLARGPGGLVGHVGGIEIRSGERTGPIEIRLSPSGTLRLQRTESAETGERRGLVLMAGRPVGEYRLAPGESVELSVPPGGMKVIEFDPSGKALGPRQVEVDAGRLVELQLP